MVEEGHRCPQCGGELVLVPVEPPVGVAAAADEPGEPAERRFERD